jgi:hypothetical protein
MRTTFVPVEQALRRYVDRIWSWEGMPSELPTLMPGTGAELVFHHGSRVTAHTATGPAPLPRAHLLCLRRQRWPLTADGPVVFSAVRLRAGALTQLTDIPAAELVDRVVEVSDLFGPAGRALASGCSAGYPAEAWIHGSSRPSPGRTGTRRRRASMTSRR